MGGGWRGEWVGRSEKVEGLAQGKDVEGKMGVALRKRRGGKVRKQVGEGGEKDNET